MIDPSRGMGNVISTTATGDHAQDTTTAAAAWSSQQELGLERLGLRRKRFLRVIAE